MSEAERSNLLLTEEQIHPETKSVPESNVAALSFRSHSENVALARVTSAAFLAARDLTMAELDEIKVAVSEAVSNAIIHGYQGRKDGWVELSLQLTGDELTINIHDEGIGIADIEKAMRPNYSTTHERLGLGFAFMQSFVDSVDVTSAPMCGTTVVLKKLLH